LKLIGLEENTDYVKTRLKQYDFEESKQKQNSLYPAGIDKHSQKPIEEDKSPKVALNRKKRIERIVGAFLYYARTIDTTISKSLNTLSTQQSNPTETTEKDINQFPQYCATHPNAKIRYHVSEMLLKIHSDASYMNEKKARSTAGGYYWLGNKIEHKNKIKLNGPIHFLCTLIKLVCASAAEAELAALFLNSRKGIKMKRALE